MKAFIVALVVIAVATTVESAALEGEATADAPGFGMMSAMLNGMMGLDSKGNHPDHPGAKAVKQAAPPPAKPAEPVAAAADQVAPVAQKAQVMLSKHKLAPAKRAHIRGAMNAMHGPQKRLLLKARMAWAHEREKAMKAEEKQHEAEKLVDNLTTALNHTTVELQKKAQEAKVNVRDTTEILALKTKAKQLSFSLVQASAAKQALKTNLSRALEEVHDEREVAEKFREDKINTVDHCRGMLDDAQKSLTDEHSLRVGAQQHATQTSSLLQSVTLQHRSVSSELEGVRQVLATERSQAAKAMAEMKAANANANKELTALKAEHAKVKAELARSMAAKAKKERLLLKKKAKIAYLKKDRVSDIRALKQKVLKNMQASSAKSAAKIASIEAQDAAKLKKLDDQALNDKMRFTKILVANKQTKKALTDEVTSVQQRAIKTIQHLSAKVKTLGSSNSKMSTDMAMLQQQLSQSQATVLASGQKEQAAEVEAKADQRQVKAEHKAYVSAKKRVSKLKSMMRSKLSWLKEEQVEEKQNKKEMAALMVANNRLKRKLMKLSKGGKSLTYNQQLDELRAEKQIEALAASNKLTKKAAVSKINALNHANKLLKKRYVAMKGKSAGKKLKSTTSKLWQMIKAKKHADARIHALAKQLRFEKAKLRALEQRSVQALRAAPAAQPSYDALSKAALRAAPAAKPAAPVAAYAMPVAAKAAAAPPAAVAAPVAPAVPAAPAALATPVASTAPKAIAAPKAPLTPEQQVIQNKMMAKHADVIAHMMRLR